MTASVRAWRRHAKTAAPLVWVALVALLAASAIASGLAGGSGAVAGGPSGAASGLSAPAETATPPKITKQPTNKTVNEGEPASFESTASGTPVPTVQWERSINGGSTWATIEGATSTVFTIPATQPSENGYQFRAVFTNSAGKVTSKAATLTVRTPPAITQQPASIAVPEGQTAVFEAAASGTPAPTVQWELSTDGGTKWTSISGATSSQLTIPETTASLNGHKYRAKFKNIVGTAISEAATLTVLKAPAITKQPLSLQVKEGENATFEATASGSPPPIAQWEVSTNGGTTWAPIEGATSNQLTITAANASEDGNQYRALFKNQAGEVTSEAATLTVHSPPAITLEPSNATVLVGESAVFEATASGSPTPTQQWEVSTNGGSTWSTIEGATSNQLTIANTTTSQSGNEYRAAFTNVGGTTFSQAATLTVATNKFSAVAWGQNLYRQLGDGSVNAESRVPVSVVGLKFVDAVAAGGRHSLALLADGTVRAWGFNEDGQLGNGGTSTSNVPVVVSGLSGAHAIAAGGRHSLALLSNGTVMAWGSNESGQLGTGSSASSEEPVAVKGLSGVTAIAAGANHSLALLSNGTVMAWGNNESGQLGTAKFTSSNVPVAVKALSGAIAVSAGTDFSLALLSNGTVKAWGSNLFGQLGNESVEESSNVPVAVSSLSGVASVAAGAEHALALLSSGSVMAWGEDKYGELGDGTIKAESPTPVAVSGLSGVRAISAGGQDSAAVLAEGSLMTWGINEWGTLGDGFSGAPSAVPVAVQGIAKAASVSAGGAHMLAYGEPLPAVTAVSPKSGSVAGGNTVTISGADLGSATQVSFGTAEASGLTINSSTSLTVTAPAHAAGVVDVTVVTTAGTSAKTPADRYTYQGPPTVIKLSPKLGSTLGGTTVTIIGTEFTGIESVQFGASSATSFTVVSPTVITATSPPLPAGIVNVTVTNAIGTSAISSKDHFKYTPTVESVTPNSGSTAGGEPITVTGTGFSVAPGATAFKFAKAKATGVSCASSTSCTMTSPPGVAGTVDVTAIVNKAVSPVNVNDKFTYS